MKPKEVRAKSDAELAESLAQFRREGYQRKVQGATGQPENPARAGALRRDIARILTVLGERHRAAASLPGAKAPAAKVPVAKSKAVKSPAVKSTAAKAPSAKAPAAKRPAPKRPAAK